MKKALFIGLSVLAVSVLVTAIRASGAAAGFPTKPITFIVPNMSGDPLDLTARLIAPSAEKELGQRLTVVNKAGAGTQVGLTELVQQQPDGYTISMAAYPRVNTLVADPTRKAIFTLESFTNIMSLITDPGVIFVKADSPYKTFKDLIDDAKKRPGQITVGAASRLSDDHLYVHMIQEAAGVRFRIVNFDTGAAEQNMALLGGHIAVSFDNVGGIAPRMKEGLFRVLTIADPQRSRFLPDVPTTAEVGYPKVISSVTRIVVGPKGMPDPVVKRLQDAFTTATKDPEFIKKANQQGLDAKIMTGSELIHYRDQIHAWVKTLMPKLLEGQ